MKTDLNPIPTPPTLVISVGRRANETAADVRETFLCRAAHRRVTTVFLSLQPGNEKSAIDLQPLGETGAFQEGRTPIRGMESEAVKSALEAKDLSEKHAPGGILAADDGGGSNFRIETKLEAALHELRTHERLIEVGLGDERDLPLGVIVLADLTDPSAACLPPLLYALRRLLEREPNHYAYLLSLTAIFAEGEPGMLPQALAYLNLGVLERQAGEAEWPFHIFLFDRFKEGIWEVKDETELCLLAGNFLLALLSGRFAQRLDHLLPRSDVLEKGAFYNAAAATLVLFDPAELIENCARKLASRVLEEFCAREQTPTQAVEQIALNIHARMGALREWSERACEETPFRPHPGSELGFELHLADLRFEGLPVQEWGDAIAGYATYYQREMAPPIVDIQNNNLDELREEVLAIWLEEAERLPGRDELYPGGLDGAVQVVQRLGQLIQKRLQVCLPIDDEEAIRSSLESAYESAMEGMDRVVSNFRALPRWLSRLPRPLYSYAVTLFTYIFRRREHRRLVELREACVRALEQKISLAFEQDVRRSLTNLCHMLMNSLTETSHQLNTLVDAFEAAQARIKEQNESADALASPFRTVLINESLLAWAFERFRPARADLRSKLLDAGILFGWKQVTAEQLEARLLGHCQEVFWPLGELDVEELLQRSGEDVPLSTFAALTQGAVPLLRPDFDLAGDGVSFLAQFCLCADPHDSQAMSLLKTMVGEWQGVPTGDATMSLICRVRLMLTGSALGALFRRGQGAFEALSDEQRNGLPGIASCREAGEETE